MRRIATVLLLALLTGVGVVAVAGPASAAPCEKTWANPGTSGVWDQGGVADGGETQWSPAGVPTPTDTVCLPIGAYTVTVNAGDAATHHAESLTIGAAVVAAQPTLSITAGTVEVHDDSIVYGTLSLPGGAGANKLDFVGAGLDLTIVGSMTVGGGKSVRFASTVFQQGGLVIADGTIDADTYNLVGPGRVIGHGTINADVSNSAGVMDPGNTEVPDDSRFLNIIGSYTQGAGGIFHVDLDGQFNTVNQDHMHVTEVAHLGGILAVDMTEGPVAPADILIGNGVNSPLTPGVDGSFAEIQGIPASWIDVNPGPAGAAFGERRVEVVATPSFNDVPVGHAFFPDIEWLVLQEITGGFPDGGYHPTSPVTRQSMAAFLYRLAGEPIFKLPEDPLFNDVPESHPFYTEISWLALEEITGGFPDGGFHPTSPVTRQSMAAFLYRLAGEPAFTPPGTASFPDVPTSSTFFLEVEWLADTGITSGFADGGFHPASAVTRQSMAAFLHRFFDAGIDILPS